MSVLPSGHVCGYVRTWNDPTLGLVDIDKRQGDGNVTTCPRRRPRHRLDPI
jgi:hypothetical protein